VEDSGKSQKLPVICEEVKDGEWLVKKYKIGSGV
jgi:hypothetical protein